MSLHKTRAVFITLKSLPWSKNRLNKCHWGTRNSYNNRMREEMYLEILRQVPDFRKINFKKAEIIFTLYFSTNRRRDSQNYRIDGWIDGIVDAGIILDDNSKILKRNPEIQIKYDKANPRTEILIRRIN